MAIKSSARAIITSMVIAVIILAGIAINLSNKTKPSISVSTSMVPASSTAPAASEAPEKAILAESIADSIEITRPAMNDTFNEISKGAILFGAWAAKKMKWKDLTKLPRSKYSLVMKDSDEQRGKLLCAKGKIVEIAAEKISLEKVYHGGMATGDWDNIQWLRFIAIGSTGELVENSFAKFCGVIIGKQGYLNSAGGSTHAVFLVGMFDLPENKQAVQ